MFAFIKKFTQLKRSYSLRAFFLSSQKNRRLEIEMILLEDKNGFF